MQLYFLMQDDNIHNINNNNNKPVTKRTSFHPFLENLVVLPVFFFLLFFTMPSYLTMIISIHRLKWNCSAFPRKKLLLLMAHCGIEAGARRRWKTDKIITSQIVSSPAEKGFLFF